MADQSSLSNIWNERQIGVELSVARARNVVTHEDISFVCNYIHPFIQLVNSDAVLYGDMEVKFITTKDGWVIHDYGEAISTSAPAIGKKPKQNSDNKDGKDGSSGGEGGDEGGSSGSGSISGQINVIAEIAKLIAEKGWVSVELIAGSEMMQRFAWIESKKYGFDLNGYTPSAADEKCYERLRKRAKTMNIKWEMQPTPGVGIGSPT